MDKKELGATNNDKIENLNLVALRKYACPKISSQKDWYLKCVDCKGLDGCPAGKRALAILEEQTKSENPVKIIRLKKDKRREPLIKALESKDPVQYLLDKGMYGGVRWRAVDALKKFKTTYDIPDNGAFRFEVYTNDASLTLKSGPVEQRKRAMDKISGILNGVQTVQQLMEYFARNEPTTLAVSLNSRLYDWVRNYPDICGPKKAILVETARSLMNAARQSGKNPSVAEAYTITFGDIPPVEPAKDDEEVSVEDFLKETAEATPEPEEDTKQDVPPEKPVKVISCDMAKREKEEQDILLKQFSKKRKTIKASLAILDEDLAKIYEALETTRVKQATLNRQLEILDETARMFGMFPEGDQLAV